jgi:4-hydroxy-2-oxoheptanedioate aldolase
MDTVVESRLRENRLRRVWSEGRTAVNLWMTNPTVASAEALGAVGYDSVVLDMQHAPLEFRDVYTALVALSSHDVTPLVRLPWNEPSMAMKLLDAGAAGLICPMIDRREQAEAFVRACRYPPDGMRSYGPFRASRWGDRLDYFKEANRFLLTIAQIESIESLDNVSEIAATPGLDAIWVGPVDLSISAGEPPVFDPGDAVTVERHRRIIDAGHAAGVKVGVMALALDQVPIVVDWGADVVSVATDSQLVVAGAAHALAVAQATLAGEP